MELNSWLQSIASRRWPILPGTLVDLRQACARHPDLVSFADLANLVLSDPLLLFDMIRVTGGSRALQRNETMPSVEQSLMLIGLEAIVNRFNGLSALEPVSGSPHPAVIEDISMWLGHGRVAAIIAKDWLSLAGEHKVEDCYIAALIYNLPACFYLLLSNRTCEKPLLQEVSENFGIDYPKLLEQFVTAIRLPLGLLPVLSTSGMTPRKQLLRLAVATANGLVHGSWRSQWWVGIEAAARVMGVSAEEAYHVVPYAVLQVANHPRAMGYQYPARELLMLPGEFHQREMHMVPTHDHEGALDVALRDTVRQLVAELGLPRVLFLRYDAKQHCLKLRYQVGLEALHPLRSHVVTLEPGSFFALLTTKQQSFHADGAARAKLMSRYADPFFGLLAGDSFAAMSLFDAHQLVGVFYVDGGAAGQAMAAGTYQCFKEQVVRLTAAQAQ